MTGSESLVIASELTLLFVRDLPTVSMENTRQVSDELPRHVARLVRLG